MSDWVLIPCLVKLRSEFDEIAPGRNKASDGSIGDKAHQQETSDHNDDETGSVPIHDADHVDEVHAIDVTAPITGVALTMEEAVQFLLSRCRSGTEDRLRYIIYNRRIWEASNGWKQRAYTGASAHTEHAHFSGSYETSKEADTRSWGLAEHFGDDVALTDQDKKDIAREVWALQLGSPYVLEKDGSQALKPAGDYQRYTPSASWHQTTQAMVTTLAATLNAFIASETTDDASKTAALKAIRDAISALAPSVAATVIAALPKGSDAITQDEVTKAVESAFSKAFGTASVLSS